MSHSPKNHSSFRYAIRRHSSRGGPWQERLFLPGDDLSGTGLWLPTGALATGAIRAAGGKVETSEGGLPWADPGVVRAAKACARVILAFWRRRRSYRQEDLGEVVRCARRAEWMLSSSLGRRDAARRLEVDMFWRLPTDRRVAAQAAVCLSTWYGLRSGRLRLCTRCGWPFAAPIEQPGRRTCGCSPRPTPTRLYVNWLSGRDPRREEWRGLTQGVATWVARGIITRREGDGLLRLAADDLERLPASEWRRTYGRHDGEGLHLREGRGARAVNKAKILAHLGLSKGKVPGT